MEKQKIGKMLRAIVDGVDELNPHAATAGKLGISETYLRSLLRESMRPGIHLAQAIRNLYYNGDQHSDK